MTSMLRHVHRKLHHGILFDRRLGPVEMTQNNNNI